MQTGYQREIERFQQELQSALYKDAESKHRKKLIEIKVSVVVTNYYSTGAVYQYLYIILDCKWAGRDYHESIYCLSHFRQLN